MISNSDIGVLLDAHPQAPLRRCLASDVLFQVPPLLAELFHLTCLLPERRQNAFCGHVRSYAILVLADSYDMGGLVGMGVPHCIVW